MKTDYISSTLATKTGQQCERVFVEWAFFNQRLLTRSEKRWVHGPPTHHQIYKQPQRSLVKETAAHRKEKLFAPTSVAKEHSRHGVHVEEGTMIGHQQNRPFRRQCVTVLQTVEL